MRKTYIHWLTVAGVLWLGSACTDEKNSPVEEEELVGIESLQLTLSEQEGNLPTRAISDYAVNSSDDPTASLTGRETWTLHVEIYKGNAVYQYGVSDFTVGSSITTWEPETPVYFPNYSTQRATLSLYPVSATEPIGPNQSAADGSALLQQDILVQNGSPTVNIVPAHIPHAQLRHAHSMLDFRLENVNDEDIFSVTVLINGIEYIPYQVADGNYPEYMLIIPVGTANPVVRVYTQGGELITSRPLLNKLPIQLLTPVTVLHFPDWNFSCRKSPLPSGLQGRVF
ncbi:MAG: hypothetical protein LIP01_00100 [Tannerellaceae bacterium]|nr:hypothetical protein [Tannerellaceae bacterium]